MSTTATETMCSINTDHVQSRRRLVGSGWLVRPGLGRALRCVGLAALPDRVQAIAEAVLQALGGADSTRWAADPRAAHAAGRAASRGAWLAAHGAVPAA